MAVDTSVVAAHYGGSIVSEQSQLLERIVALEQDCARLQRKSKRRRLWRVVEKLLVPLSVALLAYAAHSTSNKIAETQIRLSAAEEHAARQLKYLELMYSDISSSNPERQIPALGLLLLLEPDVGENMAMAVEANPSNRSDVRERARQLRRQIRRYGPLINFKIGIYFPSKSSVLSSRAQELEQKLIEDGFPGLVALYPKSDRFFLSIGDPQVDQIRYETIHEKEAAEYLHALLGRINRARKYKLVRVTQPSSAFLSIFLVEE